MGKENNRFYEDFDRVNRELNQITNGPKKEQKAIDPKRKIFDGEHDPDPSDVFDKWEREKKLNSVVASYPTSESNVEFLKAKREILKKEQEKAKQKKKAFDMIAPYIMFVIYFLANHYFNSVCN